MNIERIEHGNKGAFIIQENHQRLAEMTYSRTDKQMIIEHTEVSDVLKGKGIGKQLVTAAVEFARENHITIYAKSIFERTPEFSDVLTY